MTSNPDQPRASIRLPGPGSPVAGGFLGPRLHAEWTKFRTVRGWVIGMIPGPAP